MEIRPDRFEELVADALDALPEELGSLMDNVAVIVDHDTPAGELFGLYEGIPLTNRETYGGLAVPDRITIYRRTVCAECTTEDAVADQVRRTLIHEVGHHFGIDDHRLRELGW